MDATEPAALPPCDKENPDEAGLLCRTRSDYKDLCKDEFCTALTLTDQSDMIAQGGLELKVYQEGESPEQLPKKLIKLIREHCRSNIESLMKTHLFDFEGDPHDDASIGISQCFVPVDPKMKGSQQESITIPIKQILEQMCDKVPPQVIRMYGDPGDGKTSLMMHITHYWSAEVLKLTDEELSTKCPCWNTIVYLSAPKIKGTVEEAILDELGCKESDVDTLMNHVRTGDGTGVFIDCLDEVQDQKVMENIKRYVHQRKRKGGPTVLIAARTNLCPIDAIDIDRTITVQGFTEAQGLEYVKKYTEICEVSQQPEQPPLVEYVTQHRQELKSVLTNPLRLYVFSALAVRGELDLVNERVFSILKLFGPLERILLRREGSSVTDEQHRDFYELCMYGLLNGLMEFPEGLLASFNIAKPYYVFLRRSSCRGPDGAPIAYYSFSHQTLYEYFASRYMHSLTTEQRKSLLLLICSNDQLRNVQYIIFQLLLQDWEAQKDLIVSMIRCMVILQFSAQRSQVDGSLIKLMSLRYRIPNYASIHDMLDSRNSEQIWKELDDAFERAVDMLQESGWFGYLCMNRTVDHVMKCVRACSQQQQETIFQSTLSKLLPCRYRGQPGDRGPHYFQVDSTRWGQVNVGDGRLSLFAWCPADAYEVLKQYLRKYSGKNISEVSISFREDYLLGKAPGSSWGEDEWYRLTRELTAIDELFIGVSRETPLDGMLSCLADYATQLKHSMMVRVSGGTVNLGDLHDALLWCSEVSQLSIGLHPTSVIVPSGQDETTLIVQRNLVCRICRAEYLNDPSSPILSRILRPTKWKVESGESYVWSDGMCNSYDTYLQLIEQF